MLWVLPSNFVSFVFFVSFVSRRRRNAPCRNRLEYAANLALPRFLP